MSMDVTHYYLGCPAWSHENWVGTMYPKGTRGDRCLRYYARLFNASEGNSTFYGLPKPDTVERWKSVVPSSFRFCCKFPKRISHELQLTNADAETHEFLRFADRLGDYVGTLLLQLPPTFDRRALTVLRRFIESLPRRFCYAMEVRNDDFHRDPKATNEFIHLLTENGVNYAMFDTTVLHAIRSNDPVIINAQRRKPTLTARFIANGAHPFLRFVGYESVEENMPRLAQIADQVATWIGEGRRPYVFMHSPSFASAPELGRRFHRLLAARLPNHNLGELAPLLTVEKQQSLFDFVD